MPVFVDSQTQQYRLSLCRQCPQHYIWLGKIRCKICRCFMGLKTQLSSMECPLGYWGRS
jgi:hypothetical protein